MTEKEKLERIKSKVKEFRQRWYAINTDFAAGQKGALTDVIAFIDSMQEEPKCIYNHSLEERQRFCKYCSAACQVRIKEEPVSERFAFKAIPRLLEMIEPTDRAKSYIAKLADTLEVEGYLTDAKIVRESLKIMNGEKVPMATMDEEPVSKDYRERYKRITQSEQFKKSHDGMSVGEIMHVEGEECISEIDFGQELYKAFGQVKDFTLGLQIAKRFYDMGKNHQEPVSEDFKIALNKKLREAQDWTYIEEEGGECPLNEEFGAFELKEFAEWGAKWQREQFEKNRLKHCYSITNEQAELEQGFIDQHLDKHQRMPTFLDAIEYGMRLQKQQDQEHPDKESFAKRLKLEKEEWEDEYRQQMMKEAVEGEIVKDIANNLYIGKAQVNKNNFKFGEKVRLLVLKEE